VVGDELVVAAEHPAEVADAGLLALAQCYCDREARGVGEGLGRAGQLLEPL
jgi:hypothetical protein